MKVAACAVLMSIWMGDVFAENQEPPVTPTPTVVAPAQMTQLPPPPVPQARPPRWMDQAWSSAINALRTYPRAGDIQSGTIMASLPDVFDVDEAQQAKIKKLMDDYDAALLQRSKRWLEETATLRAECENQLLELIPEARRETARKTLDLSHKGWSSMIEQDALLQKDRAGYSLAIAKNREEQKNNPEAVKEFQQQMGALSQQRQKAISDFDADVRKQVRALLSEEEAARLDKCDRSMAGGQPVPHPGQRRPGMQPTRPGMQPAQPTQPAQPAQPPQPAQPVQPVKIEEGKP